MQELAEVRAAEEVNGTGGFDVVDSRSGEALAWRGYGSSAYGLAEHLNRAYPPDSIWPAFDTLVHEVIGLRITGVAG